MGLVDKIDLEIIKNARVVCTGGASFPTHVKLDTKVDTLKLKDILILIWA